MNPLYYHSSDETIAFIEAHINEDLEELARREPSPLQPALAATPAGLLVPHSAVPAGPAASRAQQQQQSAAPLSGSADVDRWLVLQVVSAEDVSLSREQRFRALLPSSPDAAEGPTHSAGRSDTPPGLARSAGEDVVDEATAAAVAEALNLPDVVDEARRRCNARRSGGRWRLLQLVLTDGYHRVLAVEDTRSAGHTSRALLADGVVLGEKLKVHVPAGVGLPVRRGVLRLHDGNTKSMGGSVLALQLLFIAVARQQLHALTGRPSRQPRGEEVEAALTNVVASSTDGAGGGADPPPVARAPEAPQPPPPPAPVVQPPWLPLEAWTAHVAQHPDQPFRTRACITEVVSDMLINEYQLPHAPHTAVALFMLMVQLSPPPPSAAARGGAVGADEYQASTAQAHCLTVDLGHRWLQELVGMPAAAFQKLSLSSEPADVQQLERLVERVGYTLECFGLGEFVLQKRPVDGVVEVQEAHQVLPNGS